MARWGNPALLSLLVLVAGVALRFSALTRQSLWDDEMVTSQFLSLPVSQLFHRLTEVCGDPPFFHLQLRLWTTWFGTSLLALRANVALWGSLGLIAFYRLLKRSGLSPVSTLIGTSLLAFSSFHLAYSQEVRPYSLAIFLGICGFLLLERARAVEREPVLPASLLAIQTMLLLTHYWGLFVVAAQGLVALRLIVQRNSWKAGWRLVVPWALFAVWLPSMIVQATVVRDQAFWAIAPSLTGLLRPFGAFASVRFDVASSEFFPWPNVALPVILSAAWLVLAAAGLMKRKLPTLLWLGLGLGVPFLISYRMPSVFVWYRYTSLIFPAFIWLVADGVDALRSKAVTALTAAIVLIGSAAGIWTYFTTWEKANPKSVMTYVNALPVEDTIVVRPGYFANLYAYYDKGGRTVLDEDAMLPDARARLQSQKQLVLIAFDAPEDITDAFLREFHVDSSRHFPGTAHLGVTVYLLSPKPLAGFTRSVSN